jgi:hypothetical protein
MEALKRLWNRILVAFAVPAEGHGASGARGDALPPEERPPHAPDAKQNPRTWKSHSGDRK